MNSPNWVERALDWEQPLPWYKTLYIRLFINPADTFFVWWYWKVTNRWVDFKNAKMRLKHGYDYGDVWNMNLWFVNGAVPILEHWIEHGVTYPEGKTPDEWKAILTEMMEGFKLYKTCHNGEGILLPEENWTTVKSSFGLGTYINKHRYNLTEEEQAKLSRSLDLFKEYFHTLWD